MLAINIYSTVHILYSKVQSRMPLYRVTPQSITPPICRQVLPPVGCNCKLRSLQHFCAFSRAVLAAVVAECCCHSWLQHDAALPITIHFAPMCSKDQKLRLPQAAAFNLHSLLSDSSLFLPPARRHLSAAAAAAVSCCTLAVALKCRNYVGDLVATLNSDCDGDDSDSPSICQFGAMPRPATPSKKRAS